MLASCALVSAPPQTTEAQNATSSFALFPSVSAFTNIAAETSAGDATTISNGISISINKPAVWQHQIFPGKKATQYSYQKFEDRHTIFAHAVSSASVLRQSLRIESANLGQLHFSWRVPQLIPGADLTQRETHDSPVRLVLVFEGDRSTFSLKNAMMSELARAVTGEELPYATLMYVWCNDCTQGRVFINPRTDRIREIVMESGPDHLKRWLDYQRDIRADYQKAFGEPPGALLGVGMMTDTDNTLQNTTAWYGPIFMTPLLVQ